MKGVIKMKKKIMSIVLAITLIVTFVAVRPLIMKDNSVKAEAYRNGYLLIPQKVDSTGIDTKTTFIFKVKDAQEDITIDTLQDGISVNPKIELKVEKLDDTFLITPSSELDKNKLYTFSFKDATWTYQTMSAFKLLATLPTNETSNVPTNTGIEMYFSHAGAKVQDYFSIEPSAKGTFEVNGNTVVFVPKGLEEKTIYTVTLKAGLTLAGSEQKLEEDYVFSFETSVKDTSTYEDSKGYFNFNNTMNEFSTSELPKIPMNYYINDPTIDEPIKTTLYAYSSADEFMKALSEYTQAPFWSYYGMIDNKITTKGLSKALSFNQAIERDQYGQQFLNTPQKLPAGFYLVDSTWNDAHFQTFIQVTDLSFFYMNASNKSLLWMNDLKSGMAVSGATVTDYTTKKSAQSDASGIVELPQKEGSTELNMYKIEYENQHAVVLNYNYNNTFFQNPQVMYWRYLQTDRNLYQPDDTVSLWGFLKNRYKNEKIDEVTIAIESNNWRFYDYKIAPNFGDGTAYESKTVKVENGFYEGTLDLPNLDPGSYQVNVKLGDEIISSTYIQIDKYVKPEYKIEVTSDKAAIFVGEPINFTVKTKFFEGTPVSKLEVNYNLSGTDYKEGQITTDLKGEGIISYTPQYVSGYQGLTYMYLNAYATLPEAGQISTGKEFKVFMNNIDVNLTATVEGEKATLTAQAHKIVLDKLNDKLEDQDEIQDGNKFQDNYQLEEDDKDYLGAALSSQTIKGSIYRNEWKKREVGQYYDFINKVVVPQYDYYTEKTVFQEVTLTTDDKGSAQIEVILPNLHNSYYTAELTTQDLSGRTMKFEQYFGEMWQYSPYNNNRYLLKSEQETFSIGDPINVQFMNNEEPITEGSFLYASAQNGINSYEVTTSSKYKSIFDASYIPNVEILGVYFNGKTYIQAESFSPRLDIEKNRIEFTAETDKASYKPGETVSVKLKATIFSKTKNAFVDAKGVAVNISVVDEALFQLSDQNTDVLQSLYEWVPNGINNTYASHKNDGYNMFRPMAYGMGGMEDSKSDTATTAEAPAMDASGVRNVAEQSGSAAIRTEFKDTAYFTSIQLNDQGVGTFTYKLPDNVTSWRMTFAGISKELMAGTNIEEVMVTLPYFINATLNSTYLVADQPFVGVTAYGTELKEGEKITYEVTSKDNGYKATLEGNAFERVNVPLFTMTEGTYNIVITATSTSGYKDAIEKKIKVVKTYHEAEVADYYNLTKGFKLTTNQEGMTKITFIDKGRGQFMPTLYGIAYSGGKRIDQKYTGLLARNYLTTHYGVTLDNTDKVNLSDYQVEDGGFAILPYAPSDLELTVKLLPLIKDEINTEKVKLYLYNAYSSEEDHDKALALYGLAILGEPILLELNKVEQISNLTFKDSIYLALAYTQMGDLYKGKSIYEKDIKALVKVFDSVSRVEYGDHEDSYLEYSALTMLIASQLDLDIKDQLFAYVSRQYSEKLLVNLEKLTYITNEMVGLTQQELSITYNYDGNSFTKEVVEGWPVTITLPSSKLSTFEVTKVQGDAALVAVYQDRAFKNVKNDDDLSVSRTFYNYYTKEATNTFAQSDIVKVQIDWSVAKKAVDDTYILTDYVPSGLKPINNVWEMGLETGEFNSWFRDIDGQKVSFYISNYDNSKPLYYYARVITPGTYNAEGIIVQGANVKESMFVGESDQITIK